MKKNNFTITHIVAAYMVLIGHQFVLEGASPIVLLGIDIHGLGMRILFLVSGYLVAGSYLRSKNPIKFLWKRLSRLYPSLIVCLFISVVVLRFVTDCPELYWESAISYFFHNLEMRPRFNLAGVFINNPYPYGVNGSLWTLPLELACYFLLIPILEVFSLIKKKSSFLATAFVVAILVSVSCFDLWRTINGINVSFVFWDTEWANLISMGTYFLIGMNFQILDLKKICNMQAGLILVVLSVCMPPYVKYVLTPYVIGYIVLSFALTEMPLFYESIKMDICYGIYLYAFPVQQMLIYFVRVKKYMNFSIYLMCLISIVVVTLIAVLNSIFIEKNLKTK